MNGKKLSCGCLTKEERELNKHKNKYELFDDYVVGYTQKGNPFYIDRQDYEKNQRYILDGIY